VPDGPDTVLDSSGAGNHMQTFSSAFTPFTAATYSSSVSPLPLRSGLANTLSLDFGPAPAVGTEDGGGRNDDNFTANDKPIEDQLFSAMTVELAFNMHTISGFQALFGKDGKPLGDAPGEDDSPVQPLSIKVRGDNFPDAVPNQLFVEWIDGDGTLFSDVHFLATRETVVPDRWYHVAFTLTGTDAELWVAEDTGSYVLKDSASGDYAGTDGRVLVQDPTPMTIGRGMFGNGVTDWSDALIDEVRVSDTKLTSDQFLFQAAAPSDADFDNDMDVDGNDFLIWQRGNGASGTGTPLTGDANGDMNVNAADLDIWKSQFGSVSGVSAVPEPTAMALIGLAIGGVLVNRRRRAD
jgi:hypothetical protein